MEKQNFVICNLRQRPEFCDAVADRIWQAWWKPKGHSFDSIYQRVRENLNNAPIPFALIACEGTELLGTASVILSDMEERPQYSPWVAAVWTEPRYRERGVGTALVEHAVQAAFALGFLRIYLCAVQNRIDFYTKRSWKQIEENVGKKRLSIFIRDAL